MWPILSRDAMSLHVAVISRRSRGFPNFNVPSIDPSFRRGGSSSAQKALGPHVMPSRSRRETWIKSNEPFDQFICSSDAARTLRFLSRTRALASTLAFRQGGGRKGG
jgi:hypothetical protein